MGYLTKWGGIWGKAPFITGRIYFVAAAATYTIEGRSYSASDDNDGLSPERALLTVQRANNLCTANVGDTIVLLPGTNTTTAVTRLNVAGVTLMGIPVSKAEPFEMGFAGLVRYPSTLSITGTSSALLSIEADNIEVCNLTLIPQTAFAAIQFRNASPDNFRIHHFYVDLSTPNASTGTYGIDLAYRADSSNQTSAGISKHANTLALATGYIGYGAFVSDGAQGRAIDVASASVRITQCYFHNTAGAWATPLAVATAADGCLIDNSVWTTAGTMGVCIDGSLADNADGVSIRYNTFPRAGLITSGLVVDNFGANEAQMVENYQEGSASAVTTT